MAKPYAMSKKIQIGSKLKVRKTLYWSNGFRKDVHLRKGEIIVVSDIVLHAIPSVVGGQDRIVPAIFVQLRAGKAAARQTVGNNILKEYSPIE